MLLGRDTKEQLGRNMLEAQNQAVQQKLAQYQGRLAEPEMAAGRFEQTATPYRESVVTPEKERMAIRANTAGNLYSTRLGYQSNMHQINSNRMMAKNEGINNLTGAGISAAGSIIGGLASDPSMKKDREPGPSPEQDLQDLESIPVD
jgi:hypothetical protein